MVKIYPPTSHMKGATNVEVYLYDDDHSSSVHRLFMPPLPVQNHLDGRAGGPGSRAGSARPSMLAASQLKALLSPSRGKSRGRPQTTASELEGEDIDDGFEVVQDPETLDGGDSRRLRTDSLAKTSGVQSLYYRAPETHKKSSFSSRSPRVLTAQRNMVVVAKDSKADPGSFSDSASTALVEKAKKKKSSDISESDLRQVENNLNECVISMAVAHATEKVEMENKLAEIQSALIYAQKFQQDILLNKVIESDERSLMVEAKLKDLEILVHMSDKVVLREEMDQKMERIGNFLEEIQSIEQAQEERDRQRAQREADLVAERDALRSLVTACTAEIAALKERLDATESAVQGLSAGQPQLPPAAAPSSAPAAAPHRRTTVRSSPPPSEQRTDASAKKRDPETPRHEPQPEQDAPSITIEVPGAAPDGGEAPPSDTGRDGSVWVDEGSVTGTKSVTGEEGSGSVDIIEERLNTASVIQAKIRDNETLLVRLNAVRGKIKSEITAWCAKFEETHGRHPSDADKSEILPFYKAYHEASLLYKQTIKELESLKSQHADVKDQIKGSFHESMNQSRTM